MVGFGKKKLIYKLNQNVRFVGIKIVCLEYIHGPEFDLSVDKSTAFSKFSNKLFLFNFWTFYKFCICVLINKPIWTVVSEDAFRILLHSKISWIPVKLYFA